MNRAAFVPSADLQHHSRPRGMFRSGMFRAAAGSLILLMLAACASGPQVRTDTDPGADFSRYRTYAFYEPLAMEESGYSTYLTERIRSSIRREMDARGYVFNPAAPDLKVNFQGIVQEKTRVYSTPWPDFYYGYRRNYWGMPGWYDHTQVSQYTEGTLTVDLVDAQRNHLVWTGAAIGRVTQKSPPERLSAADYSIASIFARYPYRAGSAQPIGAPAR